MPDIHGLEPDDLTGIAAPVNKNDQIRRLQAAVQRLKPRPGDPKTPALTIGCLCAAMRVAIRTLRQPNHVGWEDTLANHLQNTLASEGLAKPPEPSYPKIEYVLAHQHTCANVQPGSTVADICDCGAVVDGKAVTVERGCLHEFEARAADGGCISMSQPVHIICSKCGQPEED